MIGSSKTTTIPSCTSFSAINLDDQSSRVCRNRIALPSPKLGVHNHYTSRPLKIPLSVLPRLFQFTKLVHHYLCLAGILHALKGIWTLTFSLEDWRAAVEHYKRVYYHGPAEDRTPITGLKVQFINHYKTGSFLSLYQSFSSCQVGTQEIESCSIV